MDKNGEGNDETVQRIRDEGGEAVGFTANITDREQIAKMHGAVRRQMGPVDVLVNNAALVETIVFVDAAADDTIVDMLHTNLLGQIWVRVPNVNSD